MSDKFAASSFVECTTRSKSRRHWSLRPTPPQWRLSPLCDTAWGYDQAWLDTWLDKSMPSRWRTRKVIADLPLCQLCEKSRNRLMGEAVDLMAALRRSLDEAKAKREVGESS